MTTANTIIEKHSRFVNPSFIKLLGIYGYGRVFIRAQGVWLWDQQGRRYLDLLAAFGAVNLGHNHPKLITRIQEFFAREPLNLCHIGPAIDMAELAEALAEQVDKPLEISLFSSSGSEAIEAGMKLARAATGKEEFIYCQGGFHGTNLGTLSIMGSKRMRKPFEPLLPGCRAIPFGDLESLEQTLSTRHVAAFIVEPIQCEGGVVFPPDGYLCKAQH
ncbi:MAG: aminotransferase class III-fold pyridoxal phosphate-dependent enzyme, partial [Acidobacteriota bacterium]